MHRVITYEMDYKQGKSLEYTEEGYVITIRKYENDFMVDQEIINRKDNRGLKTGVWKQYHENGFVKLEGKYIKGKREGFYREYSADGKLLNTYKYEDGELMKNVVEFTDIKVDREYYKGAKVKSEMTLVNGLPHGIYREYSVAGNVTGSKMYSQGHVVGEGIVNKKGWKQGKWKEYYVLSMLKNSSDALKAEGVYEDNIKVGEWIYYYEGGMIEQRGSYQDGKPSGTWKWFYESSKILREEEFTKGRENGNLVEYSDTGSIITQGQYINGLKDGLWMYEMGDNRETGEYADGKKHGMWYHYYLDGELNFEGEFVDGDLNGKHKYYYSNGKLREEQEYVMGVKEGAWKRYDKGGNLLYISEYEGGLEVKVDGVRVKPEPQSDDH
jgi:antitoxin component YwqK of YwqJK toxin-antitoxin module